MLLVLEGFEFTASSVECRFVVEKADDHEAVWSLDIVSDFWQLNQLTAGFVFDEFHYFFSVSCTFWDVVQVECVATFFGLLTGHFN